ncbi:17631_t:CDS:2, partial [Racocetra fulgida]
AFLPNVSHLPKIQYNFPASETTEEQLLNEFRRNSIKNGFLHAWNGYSTYAWGYDMLQPVTNSSKNNFNGWGVTIIDALDTMWIMGLKAEFNQSRDFVKNLNFTKTTNNINVFETIIRYLGGLLSAYELSQDKIFLDKAYELDVESIESMKKWLIKESLAEHRLILGELSDNVFSGAFEHLGCFVPGMLGIGAKVLNRPQDLEIAIRLAETCYWAYISTHTKIAPEIMWVLTNDTQSKTQHETENLPVDVYKMDTKYYLRPGVYT